jgi:hypothetical protein
VHKTKFFVVATLLLPLSYIILKGAQKTGKKEPFSYLVELHPSHTWTEPNLNTKKKSLSFCLPRPTQFLRDDLNITMIRTIFI